MNRKARRDEALRAATRTAERRTSGWTINEVERATTRYVGTDAHRDVLMSTGRVVEKAVLDVLAVPSTRAVRRAMVPGTNGGVR